MTNNTGETQVPNDGREHGNDGTRPECMNRWKHRWQWVWESGRMTDNLRCTTCGEVRDSRKTGQ